MGSKQWASLLLLLAIAAAASAGGRPAAASANGYCDVMSGQCGMGGLMNEEEMSRRMRGGPTTAAAVPDRQTHTPEAAAASPIATVMLAKQDQDLIPLL
ncbi:hypothetical protein GOP47_0012347 [Adiantum capillus-veneris]|uniref:Uncharacterized protein n=1 Tax=Adiantum capillus-veneris TaxID=13818 RepID=A0A9D4UR76_ADICA|nr:hypothetical protein GOP47_0012347 [Adiantum capillus-veneris]